MTSISALNHFSKDFGLHPSRSKTSVTLLPFPASFFNPGITSLSSIDNRLSLASAVTKNNGSHFASFIQQSVVADMQRRLLATWVLGSLCLRPLSGRT